MKDHVSDTAIRQASPADAADLADEAWGCPIDRESGRVSEVALRKPKGIARLEVRAEGLTGARAVRLLRDPDRAARWIGCLDAIDLRPLLPTLLFHGLGAASGDRTLSVRVGALAELRALGPDEAGRNALARALSLPVFEDVAARILASGTEGPALCLDGAWYLDRGRHPGALAKRLAEMRDCLARMRAAGGWAPAMTADAVARCRAALCRGGPRSVAIQERTGPGGRRTRVRAAAARPRVAADRLARWQLAEALLPRADAPLVDLPPCPERDADRGAFLGHCAVVTGAASGIGRASATALARKGANVFAIDIDATGLSDLARTLAREGTPLQGRGICDMRDEAGVARALDRAVVEMGGLDHLVSNAGRGGTGFLRRMRREAWDEAMAENATSHFLLTRWALDYFERQGMGGAIVYVASKTAVAPGPGFGAYAIAKGAELQLARVAAIEGGPLGVRANVVNPGAVFSGSQFWTQDIRSERSRLNAVPVDGIADYYARRNLLGTEVTPGDVARAIAFLLSDDASKTTGCIVTVDGGDDGAFPR